MTTQDELREAEKFGDVGLDWLEFDVEKFNPFHDELGRFTFSVYASGKDFQQIAEEAVARASVGHKYWPKNVALNDMNRAMRDIAELGQANQRDWYDDHVELMKELWGEKNADLFSKFLAVGSIQQSPDERLTANNLDEAVDAMMHHLSGKRFDDGSFSIQRGGESKDILGIRLNQYQEVADGGDPRGAKALPFYGALTGHGDEVPADRWMKRILFQNPAEGPSVTQQRVAEAVVRAMAKEVGWEPRQLQAALWSVALIRDQGGTGEYGLGGGVRDFRDGLIKRANEIRDFMADPKAFNRKIRASVGKAAITGALFEPFPAFNGKAYTPQEQAQAYEDGAALLALIDIIHQRLGTDDPDPQDVIDLLGLEINKGDFQGHPFRGNQYSDGLSFADDLENPSFPLSNSPADREVKGLIARSRATGAYLRVVPSEHTNGWYLSEMSTGGASEPAAGSRALQGLMRIADKYGKNITLLPVAMSRTEQGKLERYYTQHGFKHNRTLGQWIRMPGEWGLLKYLLSKGDFLGHPFRGNQYSEGVSFISDTMGGDAPEELRNYLSPAELDHYKTVALDVKDLSDYRGRVAVDPLVSTFGGFGYAHGMYDPVTQNVTLFPNAIVPLTDREFTGIAAHEITHAKFDAVVDDPIVARHFTNENLVKLRNDAESKPVSIYSLDFWRKEQRVNSPNGIRSIATRKAVSETLADMGRRVIQGNRLPGTRRWRDLYGDVMSAYAVKHD